MSNLVTKQIAVALTNGSSLSVPYWEVTSGAPGPVLLVTAAQHGNEVQGAEALRRLVLQASEALQAGVIRGVPFTNPLAVSARRHHDTAGPEEPTECQQERNTNLLWPGNPEGNDIEHIVHAIYVTCGADATHAIDIHCWCKFWAAGCLPRGDWPPSMELARISALPFARRYPGAPAGQPPAVPNLLTSYFNDTNRAGLAFELAGQYVMREKQVKLAERCLLNATRFLGMMPGELEGLSEGPTWWVQERLVEVTAPTTGLFVEAKLEPGDWVEEGQSLGHLLTDKLVTIPLKAPVGGRLEAYGCHRAYCDVSLAAMHPWAEPGEVFARIMQDGEEPE
jgi:predicted deacylase